MDLLQYQSAFVALGCLGALHVLQLLIADVIAIMRRHVPGTAVTSGHDDALFRATRAHANTTESLGAVVLIAAFALVAGITPALASGCLWSYFGLRCAHALAYYLGLGLVRSIAFALSVVVLLVLFGAGLFAL